MCLATYTGSIVDLQLVSLCDLCRHEVKVDAAANPRILNWVAMVAGNAVGSQNIMGSEMKYGCFHFIIEMLMKSVAFDSLDM